MKKIIINQMYFQVIPCCSPKGDIWEDIQQKKWDAETFIFFENFIRPDKSFIDIGGWIGTTTLEAYAYNPKHIYSIEADPANFQTLKYNVHNNLMFDKTTLFNACLTDKKRANKSVLFGTANKELPNRSNQRLDNGSRIFVQTYNAWKFLSKNCNLADVNTLNIDIEGSERLLTEVFYKLDGRKHILLSLHPPFFSDKKKACDNIMESIRKYDILDSFEYKNINRNLFRDYMMSDKFFSVVLSKTR